MDLSFGSEYDEFRVEVQHFLTNNAHRAPKGNDLRGDTAKDWQKLLIENGYTARTIPKEFGGFGAEPDILKSRIIAEEFSNARVNTGLGGQGISMLVPTLLEMGTQEQKEQYIPDIINGKIRWCQGYSEPNAGSDLASLRTKAEDMGDHYQINGSKVWTSYADKADWIFCLVRTDFDCPKHEGISFLLFDMASEGGSTKPIKLISGTSPFCETFFDNVQVPKGQLVGTLNKGWEIAKYLLTHEREMIGGFGLAGGGMKGMGQLAAAKRGTVEGRLRDTSLRAEAISFELDEMAFGLTIERITEETKAGQGAGASSSILKMYGTELNKLRQELSLIHI